MANLADLTADVRNDGYSQVNAEAKVCQAIVLKAISESSLNRNVTIKGGVVMRSITRNTRRATQDIDLDFIRYSLSDDSIRAFIQKLNCLDGITIRIDGDITELIHQEYHGKRVDVIIEDDTGHRYEKASTRLAEVSDIITVRNAKQSKLQGFLRLLEGREALLTEFDESLWLGIVHKLKVQSDGRFTFVLEDGREVPFVCTR